MNINRNYSSIEQMTGTYLSNDTKTEKQQVENGLSFDAILQQERADSEGIKFSKHAGERLEKRNINLSENQLERLNESTKIAEEKGIKDSLVIMDSMAFIVNIPSNTVITALDSTQAASNVFTNIDGAVII